MSIYPIDVFSFSLIVFGIINIDFSKVFIDLKVIDDVIYKNIGTSFQLNMKMDDTFSHFQVNTGHSVITNFYNTYLYRSLNYIKISYQIKTTSRKKPLPVCIHETFEITDIASCPRNITTINSYV